MPALFKTSERRMAWLVALAADAIQIIALPLFAFGGISPADTVVDLIAALTLTKLLGWHWAFLPTLLAELTPGLDVFPTWTAAVIFVLWRQSRDERVEVEAPQERRVGPNANRYR